MSFTGSGTEAVHRGLLGLHRGRARDGRAVVRTAVEHSSVAHAVAWAGAPDVVVPVDREGRVAPQDVAAAVASAPEPVALVAVQSANHEVGTLQPVAAVADAVPGVPLFVAAGASAGRLPLPEGWAVAAASATSGAAPRASGCSWSARAPAGATRSPPTTASTSGWPASRTSPPPWPRPPP